MYCPCKNGHFFVRKKLKFTADPNPREDLFLRYFALICVIEILKKDFKGASIGAA